MAIVIICGSVRDQSMTRAVVDNLAKHLQAEGETAEVVDPSQFTQLGIGQPMPSRDQKKLTDQIVAAESLIIATPEYNGSFSAATKVIIENLGYPSAMDQKIVSLCGVAAGRIGAIKSLEQLRSIAAHNGCIVLPFALSIAEVQDKFDQKGQLIDQGTNEAIQAFARQHIAASVPPAKA